MTDSIGISSLGDTRIEVAMVTRYPPAGTTHFGRGIGSYAKQLAQALSQIGSEVAVFADRRNQQSSEYIEEGVSVKRVWREGMAAVADISQAISRDQCAIVHVQHELFAFGRGSGAIASVSLLKSLRKQHPVVTTVHGVIPVTAFQSRFTRAYAGYVPPQAVKLAYSVIMNGVIRHSDLIIVHSTAVMDSLKRYGVPRKLIVLPHGIAEPAVRMTRAEGLRELGLPDAQRAVYLGFLLPYKGVETLEAAAPGLAQHGIEALIAGGESGDERPTHKSPRRGLPSAVRRIGFVPEQLLPALFAITDVLVLPHTVGLSMSGPLSLAAAYDVPVVVSNVPTLSGILRCPEATFPAGSVDGLVNVVRQVLGNESIRIKVRTRLAEMRAEAEWPKIAQKHVEAYSDLATQRTRISRGRLASDTSPKVIS